jgi:hypothetical protein
MAVTKSYVDAMTTGMSWCSGRPSNPLVGDCYMDTNSMTMHTWIGTKWVQLGSARSEENTPTPTIPTQEQLDKYPALKQSWEEYLVIKRLLGL